MAGGWACMGGGCEQPLITVVITDTRLKKRIAETLKGSVNKASGKKTLHVTIKSTIGKPWVAISPTLKLCSSSSPLEGERFSWPVYTKSQCCDDASDAALIETNGVAPEWVAKLVATPFWSESIVFNASSITSVIAEL